MAEEKPGGQGDTKPAGDKPAADKPGDNLITGKPVGEKPAGDKPAREKPAGDKPAGDKPAGDKPGGEGGDKPAGDKPAGEKPGDKPAGDKPADAAPDKYELKLPDGAKDWLDKTDLTTIETIARANNWTNDQAQAALEQHADALAQQSAAFRTATEADPTYGGDNLEATQKLAKAALDRIRPAGTPRGDAFRKLLVKSGYGNNLEVVSMLADLGKLMAEDQPGAGGGGGGARSGSKVPPEKKLYPTMTS